MRMTRRSWAVCLAGLLLLATVAAAQRPVTPPRAAPRVPAGKLEVPATEFDAGTVERGAVVTHAFVLRNVGEHPLNIQAKPG